MKVSMALIKKCIVRAEGHEVNLSNDKVYYVVSLFN